MAKQGGRRSHEHGFPGQSSHDEHIRHPDDKMSETHLLNATKHIADQRHSEEHLVMKHKVSGGFDGATNMPKPREEADRTGN